MPSALESLAPGARVAVIRLRSLGDCILTTPALALLKNARPDLCVGVMVEPRFAPVFEGNPDIDDVLPPASLRPWGPELCLNLHGGTRSAALTALSGARLRAGFAHFRGAWVYNQPIPRAQEILGVERPVHTAEHLASAMFHLGAPRREIPRARLFTPPGEASPVAGQGPYAVIHPRASEPAKTWSPDGFLLVAAHLKPQLEPIFVAGPGEDLTPFSAYRTIAGAPLSEIKALLGRASLFLGNDSGPAHMAAAFGVPSVILFGPSDPAIWGPWQTASEVIHAPQDICSIEASRVIEAAERLRVPA
jgi:heptosyltransferase III